MPQILCGPREFSLDRMLGILARLRTDKSDVAINENVYTQVGVRTMCTCPTEG